MVSTQEIFNQKTLSGGSLNLHNRQNAFSGGDPKFIGKALDHGTGSFGSIHKNGPGFVNFKAFVFMKGEGAGPWGDPTNERFQGAGRHFPIQTAVVFFKKGCVCGLGMVLWNRMYFVGFKRIKGSDQKVCTQFSQTVMKGP